MSELTLYTVGHSNLLQPDFVELLRAWQIELLVDVRAYPRSRRFTHFNAGVLQDALENSGILYKWAGRELGGMRKPSETSPNVALTGGLRGYADHTGSRIFARGVARLLELARTESVVIMCAEKDPAHCHRSLLADHMTVRHGVEVRHILSENELRQHRLRAEARVVGKEIVYDRYAQAEML